MSALSVHCVGGGGCPLLMALLLRWTFSATFGHSEGLGFYQDGGLGINR